MPLLATALVTVVFSDSLCDFTGRDVLINTCDVFTGHSFSFMILKLVILFVPFLSIIPVLRRSFMYLVVSGYKHVLQF